MFCKQKGYLEEELDYRKQALDQAYMVSVFMHVYMYHFLGPKSECLDWFIISSWFQGCA